MCDKTNEVLDWKMMNVAQSAQFSKVVHIRFLQLSQLQGC